MRRGFFEIAAVFFMVLFLFEAGIAEERPEVYSIPFTFSGDEDWESILNETLASMLLSDVDLEDLKTFTSQTVTRDPSGNVTDESYYFGVNSVSLKCSENKNEDMHMFQIDSASYLRSDGMNTDRFREKWLAEHPDCDWRSITHIENENFGVDNFIIIFYKNRSDLGLPQIPIQSASNKDNSVSSAVTEPAEIPSDLWVGDIFTFGSYEQDETDGPDPIEWQVLAVENGRALVLSKYGLDGRVFHTETYPSSTWEECDLRNWLNSTFFDTAFTDSEKERILEVLNSTPDNQEHGTEGGNDTIDKIFLLSIDEAEKYLPTEASRQCKVTYHAKQNDAYVNEGNGYSRWWLRSPGIFRGFVATINEFGMSEIFILADYSPKPGVRPAFWLELSDTGRSVPASDPMSEGLPDLSLSGSSDTALPSDPAELAHSGENAYWNGEYDKALEYLIPAADAGNADAQFRLGYMYANGNGVIPSWDKALEYYQPAADNGHFLAQNNLGVMYYYGKGVTKSEEKAAEYFQTAAESEISEIQYNLGYLYENGYGVEQSYEQALKYYQIAADQGNADAQFSLGVMYANGKGVILSRDKALEYYQMAADRGHAGAQNNLGYMYEHGEGVERSYEQALDYYQMAAYQYISKSSSAAQQNLGYMYEHGEGVEQSQETADKYYQMAEETAEKFIQMVLDGYEYGVKSIEKN